METFYITAQGLYLLSFVIVLYFLSRPVDLLPVPRRFRKADEGGEEELPFIVLAYPVLREDAATMRSTLTSLGWLDYPRSRYRVIAIPNSDDHATIAALESFHNAFPFLEILKVPPTSDPSWEVVWNAWQDNPHAYWFHQGKTRASRDLPPKKTRQLIYLTYTLIDRMGTDWVLDYIDADSMPPPRHFRAAADGLKRYDVVQASNVAGNLLDSMAASWHAFDHMCWDGLVYHHMTAHGGHPFYVLGKGEFYRASDLEALGGFNPWLAIEDPEVGMRFWTHGRRLVVVDDPLVEEVPITLGRGFLQRYRWMLGFYQSLASPLRQMGMSLPRRMQARLNLGPVLSMPVNTVGLPTGLWALWTTFDGRPDFSLPVIVLSALNVSLYVAVLTTLYVNAWRRTRYVLDSPWKRVWYLLRVNPFSLFLYWSLWTIPIVVGLYWFVADLGKAWARTQKLDRDRWYALKGPGRD